MKLLLHPLAIITLLMMAPSVHAQNGEDNAGNTSFQSIQEVIQSFSTATDDRNATLVAQTLRDEAMVYALTPRGLLAIPKKNYVALLEGGKIGGIPREMTFHNIDVYGDLALVKLDQESEAALFQSYISLTKIEGTWKITSMVTKMQTKAGQ